MVYRCKKCRLPLERSLASTKSIKDGSSTDSDREAAKPLSDRFLSAQNTSGPRVIAPYRLGCHLFLELDWSLGLPATLEQRIDQLKLQVLESLGSGFYSFGVDKRFFYNKARSFMGAIIGLLYPYRYHKDYGAKLVPLLAFLEEECIPATASLIRKMGSKRETP